MVTGCKRKVEGETDANRDCKVNVKRRRKAKPEVDGEPDVNGKLRVSLMQTNED